jgi:hypothetical protein
MTKLAGKIKLIFFMLGLSVIATLACSNDEISIVELRGVITEGAGVGLDCEYIFQPDAGNYLVPQFLPLNFRVDGASVFIKGEILDQFADCANGSGNGRLLRIEQISAAN